MQDRRSAPFLSVLIGLGLAIMAGGSLSWASLGGRADSIATDRVHMSARMASTTKPTHTVTALTLANGAVVREFANKAGVVFAVSWRGPGRPDLQQLLGDGFQAVQADNVGAGGRRMRAPLAVNRSDLVVHTGGHPGAFWGLAYLPQETPSGFSAADLAAQ